jgi:hypothetical protein
MSPATSSIASATKASSSNTASEAASYALSGTLQAPAGLRLSRDELADIVARLADAGPITNSDVRAATGLDRTDALAILDRLVNDGRLIRTGQRRGSRYQRR